MTNNIKQFLEADALLPCPFCGGKPKQRQNKTQHCQLHGEPSASVSIYCDNPRCKARPSATDGDVYNGGYKAAKAEAMAAWNTRTPSSKLLAAFEQVCVAHEVLVRNGISDSISVDALKAAAPYRKLMGEV